jgi:DNA-binding transcriptional ArsR family regulator
MSVEEYNGMFHTLAALGEPNRFQIVELLREGPCSVNEIASRLTLSQPGASKHLGVLKRAHLVEVRAHGQQRLYSLRGEPFQQVQAWLESYRQLWDAHFVEPNALAEDLAKQEQENGRRRRR